MDKLLQLLGLAMRARKVVTGTEAVLKAVRSGEARLVLFAEDASQGAMKKVRDKCAFYSVPFSRYGTRKALGNAVGKPERVVVAVTDQGFARTMRKWVRVSDGGEEFGENARLRICEKDEYEQQGSTHHPQTDEHGCQQSHERNERRDDRKGRTVFPGHQERCGNAAKRKGSKGRKTDAGRRSDP